MVIFLAKKFRDFLEICGVVGFIWWECLEKVKMMLIVIILARKSVSYQRSALQSLTVSVYTTFLTPA